MPNRSAFAFRVVEHMVAPVCARPGDYILVQPGQEPPVVVVRHGPPNFGALLGCLDAGVIEPVTLPHAESAALLADLHRCPPSPQPAVSVA